MQQDYKWPQWPSKARFIQRERELLQCLAVHVIETSTSFNNTVYIFFIIHNNVSHIICSITILYTAVFFQSYINVYLILESVIFNVTEYVLSKNEDFWSIFFFCCVSKKKNKIKTRLKIYVITIKISNCVTFLVILYFIRRFY